MAEWTHVNFKDRTWFIPEVNVKGPRGKRQAHFVHLNDFAFRQFKALFEISGNHKHCFPSPVKPDCHVDVNSASKKIGDRQIMFMERKELSKRKHDNSLVLHKGQRGEWTPHDLRRTGATLMQELGVSPELIDRCQNHIVEKGKVRLHYLHYRFAKEKREAWELLGKKLDQILSPGLLTELDDDDWLALCTASM